MDSRYQDTVALLLDIAPFVFVQPAFAMKGGTAINLFVREMPRLSVDIDLVFIDPEVYERDAALAAIENALGQIAKTLHLTDCPTSKDLLPGGWPAFRDGIRTR